MQNSLKAITLIGALILLVGCSQLFVAGQNDGRNSGGLEGVWQTVVTPRNCDTGVPLGPTFPGILLFSHDGTMSGTSTAVTGAYGSWARENGPRQYSFATISLRYSATGVLMGSRRISQNATIEESGNSFTSDGGFQDYDVAGNPAISGCSTAAGTKFH